MTKTTEHLGKVLLFHSNVSCIYLESEFFESNACQRISLQTSIDLVYPLGASDLTDKALCLSGIQHCTQTHTLTDT